MFVDCAKGTNSEVDNLLVQSDNVHFVQLGTDVLVSTVLPLNIQYFVHQLKSQYVILPVFTVKSYQLFVLSDVFQSSFHRAIVLAQGCHPLGRTCFSVPFTRIVALFTGVLHI